MLTLCAGFVNKSFFLCGVYAPVDSTEEHRKAGVSLVNGSCVYWAFWKFLKETFWRSGREGTQETVHLLPSALFSWNVKCLKRQNELDTIPAKYRWEWSSFASSIIPFNHQAAVCTCCLFPLDPQVGGWMMRPFSYWWSLCWREIVLIWQTCSQYLFHQVQCLSLTPQGISTTGCTGSPQFSEWCDWQNTERELEQIALLQLVLYL